MHLREIFLLVKQFFQSRQTSHQIWQNYLILLIFLKNRSMKIKTNLKYSISEDAQKLLMCPLKVPGVSSTVFDSRTLQKSALIVLHLIVLFFHSALPLYGIVRSKGFLRLAYISIVFVLFTKDSS